MSNDIKRPSQHPLLEKVFVTEPPPAPDLQVSHPNLRKSKRKQKSKPLVPGIDFSSAPPPKKCKRITHPTYVCDHGEEYIDNLLPSCCIKADPNEINLPPQHESLSDYEDGPLMPLDPDVCLVEFSDLD